MLINGTPKRFWSLAWKLWGCQMPAGTTLWQGSLVGFLRRVAGAGFATSSSPSEATIGRVARGRLPSVATARGRHRSEKPGGAVGAVAVAPGPIKNGRMGGTWKDGALFSHAPF